MNRFPLENRTACNLPTHARETNTDLLRDRTPVGGYTQVLPVEFVNGRVVSLTEACRTPDDDLQHGLEFGRRSTDDLENLGCRPLLFKRLVTLAGEPRDVCFLAVIRGTVARSGRNAALRYLRLALSRFSRFAACSGAPSHRPPKA